MMKIEEACKKAFLYCFDKQLLIITLLTLVLCAIVHVFSSALSFINIAWISYGMKLFPYFASCMILAPLGVVVAKTVFLKEEGEEGIHIQQIMSETAGQALQASSLFFVLFICYIASWVLTGVFYLFQELPLLGPLFKVLLLFIPFCLQFINLLILLCSVVCLFLIPVRFAHSTYNMPVLRGIYREFENGAIEKLISCGVAVLPLITIAAFVLSAKEATLLLFELQQTNYERLFGVFFLDIPICLLFTPFVLFFFTMAAVSYQDYKK